MAKRNGKTPTTADELAAQRQDLAGRLAAIDGQLARLDPVNDWELVSRAHGERLALVAALAALDERIAAARLAERDAARQQQDAAQQQRAAAARANIDDAARHYLAALDALPLAELAAAQYELAQVGGWPGPGAGVALELARQIDGAQQRLRFLAPTWCGLAPEDKHALALADRQRAVERAERLLADMRKQRANSRHGGPTPSHELLLTYAHGLAGAKAGLLRLTEPELTPHELTVKSNSGIPELAGWLGDYWERYNESQRKAQREEAAAAGLLA